VLGLLRVTCGSGLDLLYLIHTTQDYRQYSAVAILHTFQFAVTHALGFSAFTSRILAMDLSQSHCNVKSHVKYSLHSLINFLPLFCNCQFRRLNSIPLLASSYSAGWRPDTRLFTSRLLFYTRSRLGLGLILRPTVSRPVYLGIKHPSEAYDQIFITVRQLRVCCGALSLTRGWVCRLQLLLALASAVILPWDSRPYFTVSDSRLPISSLPTTRRATVEHLLTVSFYNPSAQTAQKKQPLLLRRHV
jgi:hypothetical protein